MTHPDAVIADSCLRLAQKCDEEAPIVGLVDDNLAEELRGCADAWRNAAARHRRWATTTGGRDRPCRPSLRVLPGGAA